MMRKKAIYALSFLHGVMVVLALLSVLASLPLFLSQGYDLSHQFPLSLIVFVPFTVSHIAARRCRSIFSFLLFCVLSIVPAFLLPMNLYLRIAVVLLSLWIILVRIFYRVKEDGTDLLMSPHVLVLALFAALYVLSFYAGMDLSRNISYVLAFLYVILILLYKNLLNLESYLQVNATIENIPRKQIARTNAGAMALVVISSAALMLLAPHLGLENLLLKLKDGLVALLRLIFSGIRSEPEETVPESTAVPDLGPPSVVPTGSDPPPWAQAIFAVIRTFFTVLFIGLILFLIGYGIYSLIRRFYRPYHDNTDVQEFIHDDPDVKESLLKETILRHLPFLDPSPGGTVRRIYKKTIEKGVSKKAGIRLSSLSPEELEDAAALEKDEKRKTLHETYEKARYSNEPLTKDDVKKIRGS